MKTLKKTFKSIVTLLIICIIGSCTSDETFDKQPIDDYYENNDTKANARKIVEEHDHKNLHIYNNDDDWYYFIPFSDSLEINCQANNNNCDLVFELYNNSAELLSVATDNGTCLNINYTLNKLDKYFLKVSLKTGNYTSYNLCWHCYASCTFTEKYCDAIQNNHSMDSAFLLEKATLYSPLIAQKEYQDWYMIITELPEIVVTAEFKHELGNIDLCAYNSSGELITESAELTNTEQLIINLSEDWIINEIDTCYISPILMSGELNTYSLIWNQYSQNNPDCESTVYFPEILENHYSFEDAIYLEEYKYYNNIEISNSYDHWYKLCISADHLKILCNFSHSYGDINMRLHKYDGALLDSAISTNNNEKIQYIANELGEYYLHIYSTSTDSNTYSIWWDDAGPELFD